MYVSLDLNLIKTPMSMTTEVKASIEESWKAVLAEQFNSPYFKELKTFLLFEKKKYVVYPPGKEIFAAFNSTPFNSVKVVIIGQDPYHGPQQAHGLCFSVRKGIKAPPSLQNIFKELSNDIGLEIPKHGDLTAWSKQGVLLLNATLTVRARLAGSHQNKGWELFTDSVIKAVSEQREKVVFILWGSYAKNKAQLIDANKHCILKAAHPSPYSADNGFFGCKHFSKVNDYLIKNNLEPVNWSF